MKMIAAIMMLILSLGAFASRDVEVFNYDGTQASTTLNLNAAKTHIEYRYEQVRDICYHRQVYYQTICTNTPQGRTCHTVPHYRDIPYTCMRTVKVPYEVHDYYTEATVNISVVNNSGVVANAEKIIATLDGDHLSLSAKGTKSFIVVQKQKEITSRMAGGVKLIDASYQVELIEAAPVLKALNVSNISLSNMVLNVKTGPVAIPELIGFALNVKKAPILGSNTTLFDRELSGSEVVTTTSENASSRDINFSALGIELKGGRHLITAKTFFKANGEVLNLEQFPEAENLEASRTLIFKAR